MRLFREIGLGPATLLVIGNIIGIGIFTTSGLIAEELGSSLWLIGVWILGGLLALIGATCYSLLGVRIPRAGGEYAFLYPFYGPLPAFLSGWSSLLIGFSAPIAAAALGLAHYLAPILPGTLSGAIGLKIIAILILSGTAVCLTLGLKFGSRLQSWVTVLNLGLILTFAIAILARSELGSNLNPVVRTSLFGVNAPALGSAIILVMFAYSGWNAAAYIAEEIRAPERSIPRALIFGTAAVILAYVLVNIAYFAAVPVSGIRGEIAIAEIAASRSLGSFGPQIVNLLVATSIFSSLTAMSIAGPRVYFAMARDGLFPKWLTEVDERKKVPVKSIWFQSAVAFGLIAVGTFHQILLYSGFILILFATLTVSVLFRIPIEGRPWMLYRLLPGIFVLINSGVFVSAATSHTAEAIAGLVTVAAGLPVYFYYRRSAVRD